MQEYTQDELKARIIEEKYPAYLAALKIVAEMNQEFHKAWSQFIQENPAIAEILESININILKNKGYYQNTITGPYEKIEALKKLSIKTPLFEVLFSRPELSFPDITKQDINIIIKFLPHPSFKK